MGVGPGCSVRVVLTATPRDLFRVIDVECRREKPHASLNCRSRRRSRATESHSSSTSPRTRRAQPAGGHSSLIQRACSGSRRRRASRRPMSLPRRRGVQPLDPACAGVLAGLFGRRARARHATGGEPSRMIGLLVQHEPGHVGIGADRPIEVDPGLTGDGKVRPERSYEHAWSIAHQIGETQRRRTDRHSRRVGRRPPTLCRPEPSPCRFYRGTGSCQAPATQCHGSRALRARQWRPSLRHRRQLRRSRGSRNQTSHRSAGLRLLTGGVDRLDYQMADELRLGVGLIVLSEDEGVAVACGRG